jgi:hypothetical protein
VVDGARGPMNKKGKRKKGNVNSPASRRTTAPPPVVAPTTTRAVPSGVASQTPSVPSVRSSRAQNRGDHVDSQVTADGAAQEAAPVLRPDTVLSREPREDEESGPRVVAHPPVSEHADVGAVGGAVPPSSKASLEAPVVTPPSGRPEPPPDPLQGGKAPQEASPERKSVTTRGAIHADSEAPRAHAKSELPRSGPPSRGNVEGESLRRSSPPALEHEHDSFFAEGDRTDRAHREGRARAIVDVPDENEHDRKALAKMTPAVRERRARFTKYVKWAVGASAVVCLAAVVRVLVARGQHESELAPRGGHLPGSSTALPAVQPALTEGPQAPSASPSVPPSAAPSVPVDTAMPAPSASAASSSAATGGGDRQFDSAAAEEAKKAAQTALGRNKFDAAVEAAERAVTLDPTDGDAWLLLGAAYLEKGKKAEAHRAFASCVKQGKRGRVGECAMLR